MTTVENDATVADYISLLKPRVMSLVVFTGLIGLLIAPGDIHLIQAIAAIICLTLGAGAAGAFNMWYERDIDAVMNRTKKRPLPNNKMPADEALTFAIVLSAFSVLIMGIGVNWVAAGLLAFANFFYAVIYTIWLKRSTSQNIVIGGAAGAFPPMIGWAAVTGDITLEPFVLFAIIFFWTPPHFWALSLFANEDYKRANIPMLSVTHGEKITKIQMLAYTLMLFPISLAPYFIGFASVYYAGAAFVLSALFILCALRVMKDKTMKSAKQMFGYSIFYLFALFLALLF